MLNTRSRTRPRNVVKTRRRNNMKLRSLGANQTEVEMGDMLVFFSYSTPVALRILGTGLIKTDKFWSITTSRHINKWFRDEFNQTADEIKNMPTMPQADLDALAA